MHRLRASLLLPLLAASLVACDGRATPTQRPTVTPSSSPTPATIILPLPTAEPATATSAPPATPLPPTATAPVRPSATASPRAITATKAPSPTAAPPDRMDSMVTSLVVTPGQPPALYAVVGSRLFRSADQGASWSEESTGGLPAGTGFNSVGIDYRHPETMYALTPAGIYRRQGEGEWALVNTLRAHTLAVDLEDPDVLWAGIYRTTELDAVIVRSGDRGRTWGKADWGIMGGWVTDILVDPNSPNTLWAVARDGARHGWPPGDLYRGGRDGHWERLDLGPFNPDVQNKDSCFVAGIAYDPNTGLLFTGCDLSYFNGGNLLLLRSPNAGAADSSTVRWQVASRFTPEAAQAMGLARPLAVDAREPRSLYLSTTVIEPNQPLRYRILVSHDDGASWEALPLRGLP